MADNKYSNLSKDALIEEIKKRQKSGRSISVDFRNSEEKLRVALEMDDMDAPTGDEKPTETAPAASPAPVQPAAAPNKAKAPAPALTGDIGNQIPLEPEMPTLATQPHADVFAAGFRAKEKATGYVYQVAVVEEDTLKPYKARVPAQVSGHPGFFWEGNEAEFNESFSKL